MINRYQKGATFERDLVNEAKAKGKLAFRSAGSKSPIDLCIVDIIKKEIEFIQAKTGKSKVTKKYKEDFESLSDEYIVKFKVINK